MPRMIERVRREPVISRAGLAATLSLLVAAGVIDTQASEAVEVAVLAVVNALALLSARGKVTPVGTPPADETEAVREAAMRLSRTISSMERR